MRTVFENVITLISSVAVFLLSLSWYLAESKPAPLILMITSGTTVIITLLFKFSKKHDIPRSTSNNRTKLRGNNNTIIQGNIGDVSHIEKHSNEED